MLVDRFVEHAHPAENVETVPRRTGDLRVLEQVGIKGVGRLYALIGFEVVLGENGTAAGSVPLPFCQSAERFQPSRDRGGEPPLAARVGRKDDEFGSDPLIASVPSAESLDLIVGRPGEFERDLQPSSLILSRQIGVEREAGPARFRHHQNVFLAVLELVHFVLVDVVHPDAFGRSRCRFPRSGRRIAADGFPAARNFRYLIAPVGADNLIERTFGQREGVFDVFDERVTPCDGFGIFDPVAFCVLDVSQAGLAALGIRILFHQVDRKDSPDNVDEDFAGGEIEVVVVVGKILELPLALRLSGSDQGNDDGPRIFRIVQGIVDHPEQRGRLHGRQQRPEEPLVLAPYAVADLTPLSFAAAVLAHLIERLPQNPLPRLGGAVVNRLLFRRQFVNLLLERYPFVRDGPREVAPGGLEFARDQFHGGDAAPADLGHELLESGRKLRAAPPESETRHIAEVADFGGGGGRDVNHARLRQFLLNVDDRLTGLRAFGYLFARNRVLPSLRFVEDDNSVRSQPVHDLAASRIRLRVGGVHRERGIGAEQNPFRQVDSLARFPVVHGAQLFRQFGGADADEVPGGLPDQIGRARKPDGALPSLPVVVPDNPGDFLALAQPRAVPA